MSVSITIRQKAKNPRHDHHFLILQSTKNYFNVTWIFSKIGYITLFQEPEITVGSVAPVSKICASAMLVLLTVGI
jgi:hypothetical protein